MTNPLVSICVPTYNRASALRESLKSICGQDYAPLDILISDNCSEDDTEQVCREIAKADPRVRYVRQPRNIGLYGNHNFCIDESRGEFLCFFHDHDDRDLRIVSEYVAFMLRHPEVGIVCSDWELIDEAGQSLGVRNYPMKPITPGLEYISQTMRSMQSSVGAPGAMIRRSALGEIRFDEKGRIGFGDFVVWFQIAERAAIGHIGRRLFRWRQQRQSQSARTIESMTDDYYENLTRYCDCYLTRWPDHVELVNHWRASIRRYLFWALAFELGLHFRKESALAAKRPDPPTLFEILDYRLTPEEFGRVRHKLKVFRTGLMQGVALFIIESLMQMKFTWPLAWATYHHAFLRGLLGLR